jgi:hypothetical protein
MKDKSSMPVYSEYSIMKGMKNMLLKAKWLGFVALVAISTPVFADNQPTNITLADPLGNASFTTVVNNVIGFILEDIAIPLCTIMVLVGAFQMMTSAGDPEKTSKGRKTILWAAIGLVVVICAKGVSTLLKSIISGS